jgi:activator of Hsp90 ATPase-like protein
MGTCRTVLHQLYIKSPSAEVFKAISDNKELTRWFLSKALLDKEKGGAYRFTLAGRLHRIGQGAGLCFRKKAESVLAERLEEETLRPDTGDVQRGEARKRNSPQAPAFGWGTSEGWIWNYALTHAGWSYYLTNLKSVLERGYDLRSRLGRQS